ncbi:tubby domain-containing protein [Plasmodium brasilianum]|uniref:Tubby C-terminal domain-containing protein n=2 Tax=Plasmodium (Plasmodium) TaxID=418103 RepID=A0A1A8WW35_PLAMA|nr:conserved Plasmodium protein, unknown function [Plasmodium malariae]KAI4835939.1 tubby domain-containing protein [Plasmodium brasilianum]SBS97174.1 hypothetical protein, conserved in Apicomplexan species [Plasmodium malariae]SCP02874.1 conserved Plasmodium protein, unknown function [Plasmodium malariae]
MELYTNEWEYKQKRLEGIIKKEFYYKENVIRDCEKNITGGFIARNMYSLKEYCECAKCDFTILIITEYIKKECVLDNYIFAYKKLYDNIDKYIYKISKVEDIDLIIENDFLRKNDILQKKPKNKKRNVGENYIEMETFTMSIILKIKTQILNSFPMLKSILKNLTSDNSSSYYINNRTGIIEKLKKKIYSYCCNKERNTIEGHTRRRNDLVDTKIKMEHPNMANICANATSDFDEYTNNGTSYPCNLGEINNNDCDIYSDRICYDSADVGNYKQDINGEKHNPIYSYDLCSSTLCSNLCTINSNDCISKNSGINFTTDINIRNETRGTHEYTKEKIQPYSYSSKTNGLLTSLKFYEIKITTNKNLVSLKSILLLIEVVCLFHSYFIKCVLEKEKKEKINFIQLHEFKLKQIFCDEYNYLTFYNIILGKLRKKKKDDNVIYNDFSSVVRKKECDGKNFGEGTNNAYFKKQNVSSKGICWTYENGNFSNDVNVFFPGNNGMYSYNDYNGIFRTRRMNICNIVDEDPFYESPNKLELLVKNKCCMYEENCSYKHVSYEALSKEKIKEISLSEKEIERIHNYINYVFNSIMEECDTYFHIEFLFTLHTFQLKFLFNILKTLLLRKNLEDDLLIMLTYCAYKIKNKEIMDYCFWRLISIFENEHFPDSWVVLDNKVNNQLKKKYKEMKNNLKEKKEKKYRKENYRSSIFYETLNLMQGSNENRNNITEIDVNNGNFYFKKNLIDKNIFVSFIKKTKKDFLHYNDIPKGYVINEIQRLRNFNDYYSCCYILKNNKKQKILMAFKKRGENKVYIYKYDKNIKKKYKTVKTFFNISGFLGILICNFTGMKIRIYDNGISEKFSNFFPSFERNNVISIRFESNIISELPRHFICNIYKENKNIKIIYENKCPIWNDEKEIYELPFYGRVKLASAKNLQLILKKCVVSNSKKDLFLNKNINDVIEYVSNQHSSSKSNSDVDNTYEREGSCNNASTTATTYETYFFESKNAEGNNKTEEENSKKVVKKNFSFDIIKNNLKSKKKEEKFEIINKDEEEIFLIFGKNSKDYFTLDFRHPLSSFEAFSIAISSLLKKKAVS